MTTKFCQSMSMILSMIQDISDENAELLAAHPELQHHLDVMKKHGMNASHFENRLQVPKPDLPSGLSHDQLTITERYILNQLKRAGGNQMEALVSNDIQRLLEHGFVVRADSDIQITEAGLAMIKPAARTHRALTPANVLVR